MDCPCSDLKEGMIITAATLSKPEDHTKWRPEVITATDIDQWCVVNYNEEAYPSIISDVQGISVIVKSMHFNRYTTSGQVHERISAGIMINKCRRQRSEQTFVPN